MAERWAVCDGGTVCAATHVGVAAAAVALSTSDSSAVAGQPLTFTADVTAVGPGSGTPTGTVQFAVDGIDLDVAPGLGG